MERREQPRKRVNRSMVIRDLSREVVLGQLVDICAGGLMILGAEPLAVGGIYRLGLDLSEVLEPGAVAEFGAESLWQESLQSPDKHWTGFRIIAIALDSAALVERLTEAL